LLALALLCRLHCGGMGAGSRRAKRIELCAHWSGPDCVRCPGAAGRHLHCGPHRPPAEPGLFRSTRGSSRLGRGHDLRDPGGPLLLRDRLPLCARSARRPGTVKRHSAAAARRLRCGARGLGDQSYMGLLVAIGRRRGWQRRGSSAPTRGGRPGDRGLLPLVALTADSRTGSTRAPASGMTSC
jgi:hypothetical protein